MLQGALAFKELLAQHFVIDDWDAVDLVLAIVLSHKVAHTEMLWVRIIGASGTGKTEMLRAVGKVPYAARAEHLTPAALRGGYIRRTKGEELEPLLLARVNGKLLVTKEFASILTSRREDRNQVLGILRSIYDGEYDSDFGGEQRHLHQEGRFDWIIGTTAYVDQQRQLETQLGSRFIDLRWRTPENGPLLARKAIENDPELTTIRERLACAIVDMVSKAEARTRPELELLPELALFASRYRTPVTRERQTHEIIEVPDIESPARLSQALARIAAGLATLGIEKYDQYLSRMALDSLPKSRAAYICALQDGVRGRDELAQACGVSAGAMTYIREEMRVLGFDEGDSLEFLVASGVKK